MNNPSSSIQTTTNVMAPQFAELAFIQCERSLMGIPVEIRRSILEYTVADDVSVSITCREEGVLSKMEWQPQWVPELLLVSKKFGVMAKEAIANHACLMFNDFSQLGKFAEAANNGAQEDWRGTLDLTAFPAYLRANAPMLNIYQAKLCCDEMDVSAFSKLRQVTLVFGNIEAWPVRLAASLMYVAFDTTDPSAAVGVKFVKLFDELADKDVLSDDEVEDLVDTCRERFLDWFLEELSGPGSLKFSKLTALHEALKRRLEAGLASTEALLLRICKADMGISRSLVVGLENHTMLSAAFTTTDAGTITKVSKHAGLCFIRMLTRQ
jgi:hypothetical protein